MSKPKFEIFLRHVVELAQSGEHAAALTLLIELWQHGKDQVKPITEQYVKDLTALRKERDALAKQLAETQAWLKVRTETKYKLEDELERLRTVKRALKDL